jgi:hypothetical protein
VAAAGGIIYSTPYLLNPAYTDFTSTTATINVYVSSNFAHPAILKLDDSGASAGPYTAISTTAGTPTVITTTVVVARTSFHDGAVTLRISARTSL